MKILQKTILVFIGVFAVFAISSCSNFALAQELGLLSQSLQINPSSKTLAMNGSQIFSATGGLSPYTFTVIEGAGTVDPVSGDFVATSTLGISRIRVTDSETPPNTADAVVTVSPLGDPVTIVPPLITLSTNDFFTFLSFGGTPPYHYSVTSGGGNIVAPDTSGKYQAPGAAGSSTITVTDSATTPATDTSTVTIIEPLIIVPPIVSVPANNQIVFSAIGGVPSYTYSLESGSLGSVTAAGLYRAPANPGSDKVKVTDSSGNSRFSEITITAPQPLTVSPKELIVLTGDDFQFSASGGTTPYTYRKISGSGSILVNGFYSAPDSADYDVLEVEDNLGLTANAYVRIVAIGPLEILPGDPIKEITVEQGSSFTFTTSGGAPPYSYSIESGPGSGSIDSSTGNYLAPNTLGQDAVVRVTDSKFPTAETTEATVHIAPAAPGNLAADGSAGSPSEALLTWDNNANGEDDFTIEMRILGDVILTEIDGIGSGSISYMYGGLSPNVPYIFRIRAQHGTAPDTIYSEWSNEAFGFSN